MPPVNAGVLQVEYTTLDVTSLTNANNEPWVPEDNTGLSDVDAVSVVGHDKAATYTAQYDHSQQAFVFATISDGSDPTADTDVGELRIRVEGRR